MATVSAWLVAFRLRTLPLALSTIFLGSFLAAHENAFRVEIFAGAVFTTLCLQILSNLANDYGDAVNGVDNMDRIGPKRSLQTGALTLAQMKNAIILFVVLSFVAGITLLYFSLRNTSSAALVIMLLTGIASIGAALKYTIGKSPYGYAGFGDIAVFVFFGIVGVLGSYFLYTGKLHSSLFLPAAAMGFFSTGVLNLNNLRDYRNDKAFGKRTVVVKMGLRYGRRYHLLLILSGIAAAFLFMMIQPVRIWNYLFVLSLPLFIRNMMVVMRNTDSHLLDPELKNLALTTLLFSLLFGLGLLI